MDGVGEGQMAASWQGDTCQAWSLSEAIYWAALNHSQEIGAASVTQVSQSGEVNMFCVALYAVLQRIFSQGTQR